MYWRKTIQQLAPVRGAQTYTKQTKKNRLRDPHVVILYGIQERQVKDVVVGWGEE